VATTSSALPRRAHHRGTVNKLVPELKQQGVEAIIVVVHEGGAVDTDALENP
jgi:2',3'-cyclic-nucleotide 2'-phosphodiesterase (5'-nucleotidase family)